MSKKILELDPKVDAGRLVLYTDKYPNGIYISEEKTKKLFGMIFENNPKSQTIVGHNAYFEFDDYALRIKNFELLTKIKEKSKPNKSKSISARIKAFSLAALSVATLVTMKFGGDFLKKQQDKETEIEDNPIGYEQVVETPEPNLNLTYETNPQETTITEDKPKEEEIPFDYTPKEYTIEYSIPPRTSEYLRYKEGARERYGTLIEQAAAINGLDTELLLDICAAESLGFHHVEANSTGDVGLFQINKSVWLGYTMRYYNYLTETYETYTFTEEDINNVEKQPMLGALILRECIDKLDNNLLAAIQGYNWGWPAAKKIVGDDLENRTDHSWEDEFKVNSTYKNYMEAVLSYHPADTPIEFKSAPDAEGRYHTYEYTINNPLLKNNSKLFWK